MRFGGVDLVSSIGVAGMGDLGEPGLPGLFTCIDSIVLGALASRIEPGSFRAAQPAAGENISDTLGEDVVDQRVCGDRVFVGNGRARAEIIAA